MTYGDMRVAAIRALTLVALSTIPGFGLRPLSAQLLPGTGTAGAVLTRAELEALREQYEQAASSTAYSEEIRLQSRARANEIASRLESGDFGVGDRIVLSIAGETAIPDTLVVEAGPSVDLQAFGVVSLHGVLRSELEERLLAQLRQFIRDPRVEAMSLMRLSVQGAVASPGFYEVPASMLLSEALMVAGGPSSAADLPDLRIERGAQILMEGPDLQESLRMGLSLDQLNLQPGDQVYLPAETSSSWLTIVGAVVGIVASVAIIFGLSG